MPQSPSSLSAISSSHFLWGHKVGFFGGHCSNYLSRELGLSSPNHSFQVFVESD
jgi:hypothetical protein